ncbi:hypothetical protein Chor_004841, partial [Crotalus horridus]
FCTAAVSYFLCKFPSLSCERLCSVLHPGFVKKLQYVVPRLCLEARETGYEGDSAAFPWKMLSCPPLCYQEAALSLWKQTRFRELLREEAFQVKTAAELLRVKSFPAGGGVTLQGSWAETDPPSLLPVEGRLFAFLP